MEAPKKIHELVARFKENYDHYIRPDYKETRLRVEFIDPFFEALGWDVRNAGGTTELTKDVVHEDAIRISGKTRAPDYCFRIGGERKFFLEAKKPSVSLKDSIGPAFQLRRYSWSVKLPIGVLTDFEELAVYDCRKSPKANDRASVGRVLYFTYEEFITRYDEIHGLLSKEAVLAGSIDSYAKTLKDTRGSTEVDIELLRDIELWRDSLARVIAVRNKHLSAYELNHCVQKTIDRIIFLRMAEDRGIEPYGSLLEASKSSDVYACLCDLYSDADDKYNSGLFDFQSDTITKSLSIDNKVLKPILQGLYYPKSPYEFSVLPLEILGQVYEQFLGKVIRLTPGHRAKVEEKPEVKKAGGVYYTPSYIVGYIVSQTVQKIVDGKTPRQISKLRFLDPACGSGSFLLGVYDYLLKYHLDWYQTGDTAKYTLKKDSPIYQGGGEWRLTTSEKKRILLNNIYGVDIDRQAVEVTKLSLLLKVLEGESEETLGQQMSLWQERALPDLGKNIKCGNSLIESDYFGPLFLPDEEMLRRINAFDWDDEFAHITEQGGFDSVVGNPPWVFTRDVEFGRDAKDYFASRYTSAKGKVNLYALFVEKGISLLNNSGLFSMIVPNTFLRATTYQELREKLIRNQSIEQITDTGTKVFKGVTASTVIITAKQKDIRKALEVSVLNALGESKVVNSLAYDSIVTTPNYVLDIFTDEVSRCIIESMRSNGIPLSSYATHLISGIQTWKQNKSNFISDSKLSNEYKPLLEGKDIDRYHVQFNNKFIWYSKKVLNVLQDESIFLLPSKILIRRISGGDNPLVATIDTNQNYCFNSINTLVCHTVDNRYIVGILNSKLMNWYYALTISNRSHLTVNIANKNLKQLPIIAIDINDMAKMKLHDDIVALVKQLEHLRDCLQSANTPYDNEIGKRQIRTRERLLNEAVYSLYGLNEEEIQTVESFFE